MLVEGLDEGDEVSVIPGSGRIWVIGLHMLELLVEGSRGEIKDSTDEHIELHRG